MKILVHDQLQKKKRKKKKDNVSHACKFRKKEEGSTHIRGVGNYPRSLNRDVAGFIRIFYKIGLQVKNWLIVAFQQYKTGHAELVLESFNYQNYVNVYANIGTIFHYAGFFTYRF